MKKIRAYIVFKKDPLVIKYISLHKSDAEEHKNKTDDILDCVVEVPIDKDKKIENLVKK